MLASILGARTALPAASRPVWGKWVAVFVFVLAHRALLLALTDALYSWDAFMRLWDPQNLAIKHWLPVGQVPIAVVSALGGEAMAVRLVYAVASAAGAMLIGLYVALRLGERAGIIAALLVSFFPVYAVYSIVPYQEGLFLLALGGYLVAHTVFAKRTWLGPIVGAICISVAVLCRYEAWFFVVLHGVAELLRKRHRTLFVLAPAVAIAMIWAISASLRGMDNPAAAETYSLDSGLLLQRALDHGAALSLRFVEALAWVGLPLATWGAVVCWRRGGVLGRELPLFWLGLIGLVIVRAITSDFPTDRMLLLPGVFGAVFLAVGLKDVLLRIKSMLGGLLLVVVSIAFIVGFAVQGQLEVSDQSATFEPEAEAARLLEQVCGRSAPGDKIGVIPRVIPGSIKLRVLQAIFAHSFELDGRDPRWIYIEDNYATTAGRTQQVLLFNYHDRRYEVLSRGETTRRYGKRDPRRVDSAYRPPAGEE